jgi:hypothetical protein
MDDMHDLPVPKPFVYFTSKKSPMSLAAIIKIPAKVAENTYQDLRCTTDDVANINTIVKTMAANGKLSLLFEHETRLREIGVALEPVHPLKLLGVIFRNPQLKALMLEIFNDYFKRNGFLDGLIPSMVLQFEKGKLFPFISDFAKEVKVPEGDIRPYFQSLDWEGLVWHLIRN